MKRVVGSWPHQPAYLGKFEIAYTMVSVMGRQTRTVAERIEYALCYFIVPFFMYEKPSDASRTGVQILVRTPDGEIDTPVM